MHSFCLRNTLLSLTGITLLSLSSTFPSYAQRTEGGSNLSGDTIAPEGDVSHYDNGPQRSDTNNITLQRELTVMHTHPDRVSPECINSLRELHKMQDLIQKHLHDRDLTVAGDELESDYEISAEVCTKDVVNLCHANDINNNARQACRALEIE